SFLMIGIQTVLNLAAGTTGASCRRYLPALAGGGAAWATIYSTLGLVGFQALAGGYQAAPGLPAGLPWRLALAAVGLGSGLKKPHETCEAAAESEASIGPGAEFTRS